MRIKELREKNGLTLRQVAKTMNVSAATVLNWENGIHEPSIAELIKLADLFQVSLDTLVGRGGDTDTLLMRDILNRVDKEKFVDALVKALIKASSQS